MTLIYSTNLPSTPFSTITTYYSQLIKPSRMNSQPSSMTKPIYSKSRKCHILTIITLKSTLHLSTRSLLSFYSKYLSLSPLMLSKKSLSLLNFLGMFLIKTAPKLYKMNKSNSNNHKIKNSASKMMLVKFWNVQMF